MKNCSWGMWTFLSFLVVALIGCGPAGTANRSESGLSTQDLTSVARKTTNVSNSSQLNAAIASAVAGDVILLNSGNYGSLSINNRRYGDYVTIAAASGATPVFTTVNISSSSYIRLQGLVLRPRFSSGANSRVAVGLGGNNLILENSEISFSDSLPTSASDWMARIGHGVWAEGSGITVRNNNLKYVRRAIDVPAGNSLISGNTINHFAADAIRSVGNGNILEYNNIRDCYVSDPVDHYDGIQSWTVGPDGNVGTGTLSDVVIRGNIIVESTNLSRNTGCEMQGIGLFDGTFANWLVENNLVVTSHWHGIAIYGARNTRVVNNTVVNPYDSRNTWIQIVNHKNGTPSTGSLIRNNMAHSFPSGGSGVVQDRNIVIPVGDLSRHFVNPSALDFRLKSTSSAIDAGSSNLAPSIDLEKRARPIGAAVDVGAYEYGSTTNPVPQPPPAVGAGSLFTNQQPQILSSSDGNINYELGMRFSATVNGEIRAIRFYKSASERGTHTGKIYSSSGQLLASVVFANESASGWQQQALNTPLAITANTTYVVSVNTAGTYYVATNNGFSSLISNGNLRSASGSNGVFGPIGAMPNQSYQSTNYFRDVVFAPAAAAVDTTAPNVSITAPANSAVVKGTIPLSATASDDVGVVGVQFLVNGQVFGSEVTTSPYSINLNTATMSEGVHSVSARARDAAGNAKISAVVNYTVDNIPEPVVVTALGSRVPSVVAKDDTNSVELGVKFRSSINGKVRAVRFYRGVGSTSGYMVNLYNSNGQKLATATGGSGSVPGYIVVNFATPIDILANETYVASYLASSGRYAFEANGLSSAIVSGSLQLLASNSSGGNGVYRYGSGGVMPSQTFQNANYFVDVEFVQGTSVPPPTADTTAPSAPQNLVATAVSNSQINLSWAASTDNVGVTAYRVERCQGANCTNYAQVASSAATSHSSTGLVANTAYRFRVSAADAAGNVSVYAMASATTQNPTQPPPPPATGATSLSRTLAGTTITFHVNCGGQPCQSGKFVNGENWVIPVTSSGQRVAAVTITDITPSGVSNAAESNPSSAVRHGLLTGWQGYSADLNIMTKLPYAARGGESIIKMVAKSGNGCQANVAKSAGCTSVMDVLTVLENAPPDNGATIFRPPYAGTNKPLRSINNVKFDRLPRIQAITNSRHKRTFSSIIAHWVAPGYEVTHVTSLDTEKMRAAVPSDIFGFDYGAELAQVYMSDLISVFGTESNNEKAAAVYALMQPGFDNYAIYQLGIPFDSGAGQHLGRKPPIVFAAAMYDDATMQANVRAAASRAPAVTPGGFIAAWFQEDDQVFKTANSTVPVWGNRTGWCTTEWYWSQLFLGDNKGTCGDPYGYIDGAAGGHENTYQYCCSTGPMASFVFALHLMPYMNFINNNQNIVQYIDRMWDGRGVQGFAGGWWGAPDPCAKPDPRESPNCKPHQGGAGCLYYGVTWGEDRARPGQCVKHGKDPMKDGRYSNLHGSKPASFNNLSPVVSELWSSLRNCSNPKSTSYPCSGLGKEP